MSETPIKYGNQPLLPVRMLNEYAYCPRLGYLEWVQGEFAGSVDTLQGTHRHKRVDQERKRPPKVGTGEDEDQAKIHERSVQVSSIELGLIAKIDLVEGVGNRVAPVDYKRGKRPHVEQGAYEPERVQVCAQGLLLRENGYDSDEGVLYFCESKEKVSVVFDTELIERTNELAKQMHEIADRGIVPEPLIDSPKCPRCSLVGICLPDEIGYLRSTGKDIRPLFPTSGETFPIHIQHQGARVKKDGDVLKVFDRDVLLSECRLNETSQIVLYGGVQASTQVIQDLCRRDIPICYLSQGGWFYGMTHGMSSKNIELRRRQFQAAEDPAQCLRLARRFVRAKIANCRTLLRRNCADVSDKTLVGLRSDMKKVESAPGLDVLLGFEGTAAHRYYADFSGMFKSCDPLMKSFDFTGRNRRPPKDPINAMLSFAYSMLARELTVVLFTVGFDPYLGFYHQPRYGRASLALDLMEEFRPLIADSVVLTVVNNNEISADDFISAMGAVSLTESGRRSFIRAFERRMEQQITHPLFKYKTTYRRVLEIQARLLGRFLTGEISDYPAFVTR